MSDRTRGSSGLDDADIELLERLGAIAAVVDPVPDHVREMSRALFAFRDPDAELMEVVELDGDRLEAVRGTSPTSRMHFFEFGELSIDVELTVSGEFCEVVGVVADPGGSDGTSVTLDTDVRLVHDGARRGGPVRPPPSADGHGPHHPRARHARQGGDALVRRRLSRQRPYASPQAVKAAAVA